MELWKLSFIFVAFLFIFNESAHFFYSSCWVAFLNSCRDRFCFFRGRNHLMRITQIEASLEHFLSFTHSSNLTSTFIFFKSFCQSLSALSLHRLVSSFFRGCLAVLTSHIFKLTIALEPAAKMRRSFTSTLMRSLSGTTLYSVALRLILFL